MNLLKRFFGRGCPHRFTWPRIDPKGSHYQICLLCGTAYEYDWRMMQRTDRLLAVCGKNQPAMESFPPRTL
jgi:hypothetical protein